MASGAAFSFPREFPLLAKGLRRSGAGSPKAWEERSRLDGLPGERMPALGVRHQAGMVTSGRWVMASATASAGYS